MFREARHHGEARGILSEKLLPPCAVLLPRCGIFRSDGREFTEFFKKVLTSAKLLCIINLAFADVAHPVERNLAKVEVASSSLVTRSTWRS